MGYRVCQSVVKKGTLFVTNGCSQEEFPHEKTERICGNPIVDTEKAAHTLLREKLKELQTGQHCIQLDLSSNFCFSNVSLVPGTKPEVERVESDWNFFKKWDAFKQFWGEAWKGLVGVFS